jgi:lysophospholipase L1-like esterase
LIPYLFEGLGPDLQQPDGVHPNAEGEKRIAGRLAPAVAKAFRGPAPGIR